MNAAMAPMSSIGNCGSAEVGQPPVGRDCDDVRIVRGDERAADGAR